jgi:hypothetical protein
MEMVSKRNLLVFGCGEVYEISIENLTVIVMIEKRMNTER